MALKQRGFFQSMNLEFKLQNAIKNSKKIKTLFDKISDIHNNVPNGNNLKHVVKKMFGLVGGRIYLTLIRTGYYCALVGTRSSITMPKVFEKP